MKCISFLIFLAFLACSQVLASNCWVTVYWTFAINNIDGTPLTDLAGAKVYYGLATSNYTYVVEVPGGSPGEKKGFRVTNLVCGVKYYLNGTAYNTIGLESDFCNEVSKIAGTNVITVPESPMNLRVPPHE